MVEFENIGYEIILFDTKGRFPNCDGHILCNDLNVLNRIYKNGIKGSKLGKTRILICENLESNLENKDFLSYRFHSENEIKIKLPSKLELSQIYSQKKYELVDIFSISDLEKRILPIFNEKY